jgi:hypothetical protein
MIEYVVRFIVGGIVVSAFAMLGDVLRPKSFAGLFGAAPSVALATLGIAIYQHGAGYAAVQSQTMMAGAVALAVYGVVVCHLLIRARLQALPATMLSFAAWLIVAFGLLMLAGGHT